MKRQRILGEAEGFADPKDFCEDPKEVVPGFVEVEDPDQILEEEEVQSSDDEDDEISDSDELQISDKKPSYVRGYFMRHEVKSSALVLKHCHEVVLLCREILKYFASKYDDDGDDVKAISFLKMADQVLAHNSFKNFLQKHCEVDLYKYGVCRLGRENESKLKTANHLSLIKQDCFLEEAIKQREHWFFKTTLVNGDDEMVVRGAMSIVIPYFITLDYLKNNKII